MKGLRLRGGWSFGWWRFHVSWLNYDPGYSYKRVLHVEIGWFVFSIGRAE